MPFIYGVVNGTASTRRLVYVLPTRALVEQTRERVLAWLTRLREAGVERLPSVAMLLGGDIDDTWVAEPEKYWIVVGTQDMMLSRALNRGYASSPFSWPMAFAALNNDAHWILDEVQLQGVGVRTAAQLQGLREKLGTFGAAETTFCSATIERAWADTVDHPVVQRATCTLTDEDRAEPLVAQRTSARKTVRRLRLDPNDAKAVASEVAALHRRGTLTIAVFNTVGRAQQTAGALRKLVNAERVELLHSRFRPPDRAAAIERAFADVDPSGPGRIVVATQVVEAGLNVTCATMISELAPWPSIVQRLGRCNRWGDLPHADFAWIDFDPDQAKMRPPYRRDELMQARALLTELEGRNAGSSDLPVVPMRLDANATLRRIDLLDLFDTAPDIAGNDVDVGQFIREGDDFTASVFWRDEPPSEHARSPRSGARDKGEDRPRRDELCPATVDDVRRVIERVRDDGRVGDVRIRTPLADDGLDAWRPAVAADVRPGALIWMRSSVGGYTANEGFNPELKVHVPAIESEPLPGEAVQQFDNPDACGDDRGAWQAGVALSLRRHAQDARNEAMQLVERLHATLDDRFAPLVVTAAAWHDAGKVHEVFQDTMHDGGCPQEGGPWAKSRRRARHRGRKHFRHELVSALAWLHDHDAGSDDDLVAYLVGAHHGRLRVAAYPYPGDPIVPRRTILGVMEGDFVDGAALADQNSSPFTVDLSLFDVGSSDGRPTWADRVLALRDDPKLGPFRLAYLELLVRVADWRASAAAEKEGSRESIA